MWIEKHGKTYRIRDLVGGKKITLVSGLPNKTVANTHLITMRADEVRGDFVDPRQGKTKLADWIEIFWPMYEASLRMETRRSEGSRVRNHILPGLGHLALDELDSLAILRFVSGLKLAPKTVRNVHGLLHKILDEAVRQRLIRYNPATNTPLPRRAHREMRFLTTPEIGRLIAAAPEQWKPLITLLVATGLRYGEATALRVGDVDLIAGTVRVIRTMHHGPGGVAVYEEPKTEYSRRTVTIPPAVCLALAPAAAGKERQETLLCGGDGRPMNTNFRHRIWKRVVKSGELGHCRIHDLRHSHAAMLISANVPLTAIQRRLGHSSIKVTSDMYGHLLPEVDAGIMTAVSAAMPGAILGGNMGELAVDSGPFTSIAIR